MNREALNSPPANWPTHIASDEFWEELGRTVATLGMLEDTLAMALIVLSGQRQVNEDRDLQEQLDEWCEEVVPILADTLGPRADRLAAAWRERDGALSDRHRAIRDEVKLRSKERNRLCHGAWIAFERPDTGTVRFFERRQELNRRHNASRPLTSITETRERTATVIRELIVDTEARIGKAFPFREAGAVAQPDHA